ncbi:UDP-N-acetylglucosamine 1-carboxyvinyltransferase [Candidatus Shapirobacteria bacterium]|nr:UDP-N-acetylglucosamine 1-carboxyvinyltransferase [Candidatus Shapirobacteria bacterium]
MASKYLIKGGRPLKGAVRIGGAKNSSFKLMIASLLAEGESRLLDISRIGDVEVTREVIETLGGKVKSPGKGTIFVNPDKIKNCRLPQDFGYKSRASIMFAGPLLARCGQASLPLPGGDPVGRRPVERHLEGLKAMGAKIKKVDGFINLECRRLTGARYRFAKNTHTGTETLIMAAALAKGTTLLENAALEIEIDDLIEFLNQMGAKIKRLPGRKIKIEGVKRLKGTIHRAIPDRNEAVSYACAALATKGDIIIENARAEHLTAFLAKVKQAKGNYEVDKYGVHFWYDRPLKATKMITKPHPGFMTDWQALWTTLMTQAQGKSEVIETIYEYRFAFVKDLVKMGAKIKLFNPQVKDPQRFYNFNLADDQPGNFHGALVSGPTPLKGTELKVTDIRAGATLVLAALIAKGQSVLSDEGHIQRGYEDLHLRLKEIGAEIKKIS